MYIDFKVKTWYRCYIPNKHKEKVEELLKSNPNATSDSIVEELDDDFEWSETTETQEQLYPSDNGGASTIEAYDDDGKMFYTNEEEPLSNTVLAVRRM